MSPPGIPPGGGGRRFRPLLSAVSPELADGKLCPCPRFPATQVFGRQTVFFGWGPVSQAPCDWRRSGLPPTADFMERAQGMDGSFAVIPPAVQYAPAGPQCNSTGPPCPAHRNRPHPHPSAMEGQTSPEPASRCTVCMCSSPDGRVFVMQCPANALGESGVWLCEWTALLREVSTQPFLLPERRTAQCKSRHFYIWTSGP